jgi:hypothetical protein
MVRVARKKSSESFLDCPLSGALVLQLTQHFLRLHDAREVERQEQGYQGGDETPLVEHGQQDHEEEALHDVPGPTGSPDFRFEVHRRL